MTNFKFAKSPEYCLNIFPGISTKKKIHQGSGMKTSK